MNKETPDIETLSQTINTSEFAYDILEAYRALPEGQQDKEHLFERLKEVYKKTILMQVSFAADEASITDEAAKIAQKAANLVLSEVYKKLLPKTLQENEEVKKKLRKAIPTSALDMLTLNDLDESSEAKEVMEEFLAEVEREKIAEL